MPRPPKHPLLSKKEVGARVRAARVVRGFSQTALAKTLGIHQSNLSHIESGRQGMTIHQVMRVAKALGVSADEILSQEKTPPKEITSLRTGKLLRSLEMIEELPAADRRAVVSLLEGALARHQMRQAARPQPTKTTATTVGPRRRPKAAKSRVA